MNGFEPQQELNEKVEALSRALSTVHTVHRLLGSTLNLGELLPRVARLCLQVLRSNFCAIYLLDPSKKYLLNRTTVDLIRPKRSSRLRLRMGKGVEGEVAKTGNAVFKKKHLCIPLMDEDVLGVLSIRERQDKRPYSFFDQEILITLAEQAVIALKNASLYEEQERLTMDSIRCLAALLDRKAPGRRRSSSFIVKVALGVAEEMALSHDEMKTLHYAALLHDAGKFAIPEQILSKPSKLTAPEYQMVRQYPATSVEILKPIAALSPVMPIVLHHTERYDGKGYPKGLKGEAIPLGARILGVAKAFEAMTVQRPYRKRLGFRQAIREIKKHEGKQFDPGVVKAFLRFCRKRSLA